MRRYSNEEIASRIGSAQAGLWNTLDLAGLNAGDSDVLELVRIKGIERLQSLDLSSNEHWRPQALGRSSPDEITDLALEAIGGACPQLRSLNLDLCWKVTDEGLKPLANGCPRLQSVSLRLCRQVTDIGVSALARGCPALQSLDLSFCWQITDDGIQALAVSCPELQRLDVTACEEITDVGVQALARGCPRLTTDLRWSDGR